jgi:hypothetical protein
MDDTDYNKDPETTATNNNAGSADKHKDNKNTTESTGTKGGANGHTESTKEDDLAAEEVAKEEKATTEKTPSTENDGKPQVEETATHKAATNGNKGTEQAPTVTLDYSDKPKQAKSQNIGKYAHLTPAESKASIQEQGDKMIETKHNFLTTTKLEFNLATGITQFSVRQATTQVLLKMQSIDTTLKVKSTNDDKKWTDINTLPSDPTLFSKHFNVREENPPRGAKQIVIHFILQTFKKFGDIKYDLGIFNYLKQERIYLKVDKFEMRKIATLGFLIDIHPHLINLTYLQEIMTEKMETTRMQDKRVIDENGGLKTQR